MVGVPYRVRTIAGMPVTIPAVTPTIPASSVTHDRDTPSNRVNDPAVRQAVAMTVQTLGTPVWMSTPYPNMATSSSPTAQPRAGSAANP